MAGSDFSVVRDPVADAEARADARYGGDPNKEGRVVASMWMAWLSGILALIWFSGVAPALEAFETRVRAMNAAQTGMRLRTTMYTPFSFGRSSTASSTTVELVMPTPAVQDGVITQVWVQIEEQRTLGAATQILKTSYRPINLDMAGVQTTVLFPVDDFPMGVFSDQYRYRFHFQVELKPTADDTNPGQIQSYRMRQFERPTISGP